MIAGITSNAVVRVIQHGFIQRNKETSWSHWVWGLASDRKVCWTSKSETTFSSGRKSKSSTIQVFPHSSKSADSSEEYDRCKYDDNNIFDVRSVYKENKMNVKTTSPNKYDDNNLLLKGKRKSIN